MRTATSTFCPAGAKARAEVTFTKADLAALARKAAGPRGGNAVAQIPDAKRRVAEATTDHAAHVAECVTCNEKFA